LTLSSANIHGLYQVGQPGDRKVAGAMCEISSAYQASLGGNTHLSGLSGLGSIATAESSGPGAFGCSLGNIGASAIPRTPLVFYDTNNPYGPYTGGIYPHWGGNGCAGGVLFIPGTRTILFFGRNGVNYQGYGSDAQFRDTTRGGEGQHSFLGEYAWFVWAYDVNDFISVYNGTKASWDIEPYCIWTMPQIFNVGGFDPGGAMYDAANGIIYFAARGNDTIAPGSSLPVFYAWTVNLNATISQNPIIGSLSSTYNVFPDFVLGDSTPIPYPTHGVDDIIVVAGNVFIPSGSVSEVKFYYGSTNGTLLGTGTPSSVPHGSHNWELVIHAASQGSFSSGGNVIVAQAKGSNGLFSTVASYTLQMQ